MVVLRRCSLVRTLRMYSLRVFFGVTVGFDEAVMNADNLGVCKVLVSELADYPEHIAPRSLQKHRSGCSTLLEQIDSQHFKLAQCSQVATKASTWERALIANGSQ